jgi:hypothetical protein
MQRNRLPTLAPCYYKSTGNTNFIEVVVTERDKWKDQILIESCWNRLYLPKTQPKQLKKKKAWFRFKIMKPNCLDKYIQSVARG